MYYTEEQKLRIIDNETEEALLGNMLLYPESVQEAITAKLTEEDFYLIKHQYLYRTILSMYKAGEAIDSITLKDKLLDLGLLDHIGGIEYLAELQRKTIDHAFTKEYIRIVLKRSIRRQMIETGNRIAEETIIGELDDSIILKQTIEKLSDLSIALSSKEENMIY